MSPDLEERLRDARSALPLPAARATLEARELVLGSLVRRRRTRVRATAAIVVLVAATVVGIGAGLWIAPSGGASSPSVTGLGFLPAKGWTIVQSAPGLALATRSTAVAANVPVRAADMPVDGPPYETVRSLPPDGVVIYAEFTARGRSWQDAGYPIDGAPRIDEAYRETAWSAQIRPEDPLAQYRLAFAASGYNVEVHVYAGRLHPTEQQIAAAQRQLDRMVVASDPITLQVSPRVVAWAQTVNMSGSVSSGRGDEVVGIEERRCGAITLAWNSVGGAHTDPGGGWHLRWGAPITTTFRAVWNGKVSNVVTIRARPGVIVRQVARTRFKIDVSAMKPFEGRRAVLQRFDRSRGWRTIKPFRLQDSGVAGVVTWSTAHVSATVPKGTLVRAVFPRASAAPCYLAGYSNLLRTTR